MNVSRVASWPCRMVYASLFFEPCVAPSSSCCCVGRAAQLLAAEPWSLGNRVHE